MIDLDPQIAPARLDDEKDVEEWFRALHAKGINFHPEESFRELVQLKTGVKLFRTEDADRLDDLMDRAADLCEPSEVALRVLGVEA